MTPYNVLHQIARAQNENVALRPQSVQTLEHLVGGLIVSTYQVCVTGDKPTRMPSR